MIRKTILPTYPEPLSCVCLGTAYYGAEYDEKRSVELLDAYYAMGGRFLDTANVYGRWSPSGQNESEAIIGRWLKAREITDMVVMTKGCHYALEAKHISRVNRACAMADLEESRRTLDCDVIPIWLMHRDDETVDIREIVDFLAEAVRTGKIRRFGFSNYRAGRIKAALDYMGEDWPELFFGVSNEWSLHEECAMKDSDGAAYVNTDGLVAADSDLLRLHRAYGLPLIPYQAAAGGFYDKLGGEADLSERERRIYGYLREEAAHYRVSLTAVSLAYILNSGLNAIPVVSVNSPAQMASFDDVSAWVGDLSYLCRL